MIIDVALLGLLIYLPLSTGSPRYAAWIIVALAIRRVPLLACELARWLDLESYSGMTVWVGGLLLPAWRSADSVMSRSAPDETKNAVPGTGGIASTNAINLPDRDIMDDWIVALAEAKQANGKRKFSASKIHDLLGGHRATVLARVKEIQEGVPPPQFRQADESTQPATYPITKDSA